MPGSSSITVTGYRALGALASRLHSVSSSGRIGKAVQEGLQPLRTSLDHEIRASVNTRLPRSGGLARLVGTTTRVDVDKIGGGQDVGVRVTIDSGAVDVEGIDGGNVVHPVYNSGTYVDQGVPGGAFSKPVKELEPRIAAWLRRAADNLGRDIGSPL